MSFPQYPEVKDSGIEWLGEVPAHWEVKPLKRAVASVESGTSVNAADVPAAQGELGVLKTSCVYKGWFDWRENKTVNLEDLGRVSCPVRENTLIVSRMNTPDLVGSAGLVIEAPAGIFLPDRLWQVSMKESCSPKYCYYFTRTPAYRDQVRIACAGTSSSMQNLGQDEFGAIWHPSPLMDEQQAIAAFLDHETARIDALVEEQQRLVELLKEKRQAVISHAVTKGLDPDVPMKDSGVEWLGEVPAHWEVKPLRYLGECQNGINIGADAFGSGFPFISYGDVYKNEVLPTRPRGLVQSSGEDRERYSIKKGDVLFTRTSETVEEIGFSSACFQDIPSATFAGFLIRFRPIEGVLSPNFSRYFFGSQRLREFFVKEMEIVTRASLGQDLLKRMSVPIAPIEEQVRIAKHMDAVTQKIDSLLDQARAAIKLLAERRSALISAAVTGKIDVRGWQPPAASTAPETTQTEMV